MYINRKILLMLLLSVFSLTAWGQTAFPVLKGDYLGETLPEGMHSRLFARDVISTGINERDIAISTDGNELYYGMFFGFVPTILMSKKINDQWTEPVIVPFAMDFDYAYFEPALSPDGQTMFFLTTRPTEGEQDLPGWRNQNIFGCDKTADGNWGAVYDLGENINTELGEYFPSMTAKGILYFTRSNPRTRDTEIMYTSKENGHWKMAASLPEVVNGDKACYNSSIAPDESYLLTCVSAKGKYAENKNSMYYVFFKSNEGTWSEGIKLGDEINFPGCDAISINITPDGRYIFFASAQRSDEMNLSKCTIKELKMMHASPQNGVSDIYWISADAITVLRPSK
ncbi:PD40 domain-containing protein [bacterium]|nr:PD40 domain-containing protein [bacterium]